MVRGRDVLWALAICAALTLAFHYRPLWNARRFVQRESEFGFRQAFEGHRFINGQLIGGGTWDPMALPVTSRALVIEAEDVNWKGTRAEFIVRHVVRLQDGTPGGEDRSTEIHVALKKQSGTWRYTQFQVRGQTPVEVPIEGNPWGKALRARPRWSAHGG